MSYKPREVKAKTIEEHREYLFEIVRLKLFFLWNWLKEHPEETVQKVLRERVDIYRKTSVNTGLLNPTELHTETPEWLGYEKAVEELYCKHNNDEAAFEAAAFEVFQPSIEERLPKDFADTSGTAGYQCGSLQYNLMEEGKIHLTIGFHIANAIQPHSIFEDPQYLPRCFVELMNETEKRYSSRILSTGTWLNSLPRWLEIFPEEWQENLSEPHEDVQWHYGYWGQFITARGTFNYKYAKILRLTGKLPFYHRSSHCSFANMRRHLKDKYAVM